MRRRKMKRQKQIIIISSLCLLLCLCVGYAAFNTQISLKAKGNVKDNSIDITDNIVTEGDGLYEDKYEEGRYVYKGANPNNYIKLGDDIYRIIAIETDNSIKVMKNESVTQMQWDNIQTCPSSLAYNNSVKYYKDGSFSVDNIIYTEPFDSILQQYGCNKWERPSSLNSYLNNDFYQTLSSDVTNSIMTHTFDIGAIDGTELSELIKGEKSKQWEGKIGLITYTDLLRSNSNMSEGCQNEYSLNSYIRACENFHDTTYIPEGAWTITSEGASGVRHTSMYFIINFSSSAYGEQRCAISSGECGEIILSLNDVYPVMYLNSSIISGSGTEIDPYIVK